MAWTKIAQLDEIPRLGSRVLNTENGNIAIFRTRDDQVFAVRDRCPHKGGVLSQGIVHGCKVTCPLHSWIFDLETGQAIAPDKGCVKKYVIKIEEQAIFIEL